jgi:hypothetical protein
MKNDQGAPLRADETEFFRGVSFADLARRQGVSPVEHLEDLLGGWPEDEIDDGFEKSSGALAAGVSITASTSLARTRRAPA